MRILHYYPRALVGDGGPSIATRGWAAGQEQAGADVSIAFDRATGPGSEKNIPIEHKGKGRVRVPVGLERPLKDFDLLILHSGWVARNVVAARAARRAGIPFVVTPHGAYDPNVLDRGKYMKRIWWKTLDLPMLNAAAAAHVFFTDEIDHLRRLGYEGHVVIAPNGVEVPDGRQWDGGSGGYVLWLGRFDVRHKGLDILLQAIARARDTTALRVRLHGPDWRDGRSQIAALAAQLGLDDSVEVGPPVYGADKWDALERALCFVYPSRWEVFGLALAEAAALGVPVIGTSVNPLARELAEAKYGLAVEPAEQALAAALVAIAKGETHLLSAAGFMKERYSWSAVGSSFLDQVHEVL